MNNHIHTRRAKSAFERFFAFAPAVILTVLSIACGGSGSAGDQTASAVGAASGIVALSPAGVLGLAYQSIPTGWTAVSGAVVASSGVSTVTKSDGTFTLSGLPVGTDTITVTPKTGTPLSVQATIIPSTTVPLGNAPISRTAALSAAIAAAPTPAGVVRPRLTSFPTSDSVFESQQPLPAGTVVSGSLDDSEASLKLAHDSWFVLDDEDPSTRYGHAVRGFVIDAVSGTVTERDAQDWPQFNGADFYFNSAVLPPSPDLIQAGEPVLSATVHPLSQLQAPRPATTATTPTGKSYALLVIGGSTGVEDFKLDATNILPIFGTAAVPALADKQVIITEKMETDPIPAIKAAFTAEAAKCQPGDTFVFYVSSHGIRDNSGATPDWFALMEYSGKHVSGTGRLHPLDLDFTTVPACNILIVVDTCYSAGWITQLQPLLSKFSGKHFAIVTSTSDDNPGYGTDKAAFGKKGGPLTITFANALKAQPTTGDFNGDIMAAWNTSLGLISNYNVAAFAYKGLKPTSSRYKEYVPSLMYRDMLPTDCCPCGGQGVTIK